MTSPLTPNQIRELFIKCFGWGSIPITTAQFITIVREVEAAHGIEQKEKT